MLESKVEARLVELVLKVGGEVRKVQWTGRKGAPDRLVMLPEGWLFWVELKQEGKTPEVCQSREHERLRRMDQIVVVLDTIEKVEKFMGPYIAEADL